MALSEEKLIILKMIQEGKITAEEGAQLLETLEESSSDATGSSNPQKTNSTDQPASGKWFRVRVTDAVTGKTRTNVRMPMTMVRAGIKLGMRFTPQLDGVDFDQLTEFIQNGQVGQIVEVFDDEDGERVEVFVE
jgi:hypothetical protein